MKEISDLVLDFSDSEDFLETWDGFIKASVFDSALTFKEICACFYGIGVVDAVRHIKGE